MKAHYHVHTGMRGYIPNNTYYCQTRKDAEGVAKEEARTFADCFLLDGNGKGRPENNYRLRMVGSARSGWYEGPGDLSYHYIQIVQCDDDCDPDEENW